MSSLDRAAELRAEADALEAMGALEVDLLAAKTAYINDPTDENKAAKTEAALKLRAARAATRPAETTVGGDAYLTPDDDLPQTVHLISTDNGREG